MFVICIPDSAVRAPSSHPSHAPCDHLLETRLGPATCEREHMMKLAALLVIGVALLLCHLRRASGAEAIVGVAAQPLAANVTRLVETLDFLGASLAVDVRKSLAEAGKNQNAERLQQLLDEHALFIV